MKSLSRNRPALSRRFYELYEFGVFKNEIFNSNALSFDINCNSFQLKNCSDKVFRNKTKEKRKKGLKSTCLRQRTGKLKIH